MFSDSGLTILCINRLEIKILELGRYVFESVSLCVFDWYMTCINESSSALSFA